MIKYIVTHYLRDYITKKLEFLRNITAPPESETCFSSYKLLKVLFILIIMWTVDDEEIHSPGSRHYDRVK